MFKWLRRSIQFLHADETQVFDADDVVKNWLKSQKPALIDNKLLRPIEHRFVNGTPLSTEGGQAKVFYLESEQDNTRWILKKFKQGQGLDDSYLKTVGQVLPNHPSFQSGTDRSILSSNSIDTTNGYYHNDTLKRWLDGSVLTPCVVGSDWSFVADELREGDCVLDKQQRLTLCRKLSEIVRELEKNNCAHRDLSCGNVFICLDTLDVVLIDFDGVFHPNLVVPFRTTCGSEGYIAPFVYEHGSANVRTTWCTHADRFALALLNVEFLLLGKGSPLTFDGGMFDQDELCSRHGKQLGEIGHKLASEYPKAFSLFDAALNSNDFSCCPSPDAWIAFCDSALNEKVPSLSELEAVDTGFFDAVLQKIRAAKLPRVASVSLPDDPWACENGRLSETTK